MAKNMKRSFGQKQLVVALLLLGLVTLGMVAWNARDTWRSPQDLYHEARTAPPQRAAEVYAHLSEKLPALAGYAQLWTAQAQMPNSDAMSALRAIIDFEPQSALAYEAHVTRARYYASIEAPAAADEYRAALALNDSGALRLELARHLEQEGDAQNAYAQYRILLSKYPDAFEGMRRTGPDPLVVARDLIAATFYSDALETLAGRSDPKAVPLRAQGFAGLGRYEDARAAYQAWLQSNPDDATAQMGLAQTLTSLGRTQDALALYQTIKTPDSQMAQAGLLEDTDPRQALALDLNSAYPVAWWNATAILEAQKRVTETLPLYARVATSDAAFADDAAYRLYILGKRLNDTSAEAQGKALLNATGLDWLTIRADDGQFTLPLAAPLAPAGSEILDRVSALDLIGRQDLARMELVLASRSRQAPEIDLAMAQALSARGDVLDAQAIAEKYIRDHGRAPIELWRLSFPRPYTDTVTAAAAEFGVDPLLIWAVMREESRFDPEALSSAGARGLMQITPSTQTWIAEQLKQAATPGDAFRPQPNVRMGAWYLHFLLSYFKGDQDLALMAYNGGAASVESWQKDPLVSNREDLLRWVAFGETREYLERVSLSYRVYQVLYQK